MNLWILVNPL